MRSRVSFLFRGRAIEDETPHPQIKRQTFDCSESAIHEEPTRSKFSALGSVAYLDHDIWIGRLPFRGWITDD